MVKLFYMSIGALKHSEEAMALLILYKALKPEIKEEVKTLIARDAELQDTDILTTISFESWKQDWNDDPEENEIWENFYKKQADV